MNSAWTPSQSGVYGASWQGSRRARLCRLARVVAGAISVATCLQLEYPVQEVLGQPATAGAGSVPSACDVLREVPVSAELVIVVQDASELRRGRLGAAVFQWLAGSGLLKDVEPAWASLSMQLGLSQEQAFDRLFGKRVVFLIGATEGVRGGTVGESPSPSVMPRQWAILSDVDIETERRVRERLDAAPRGIDRGHQIFTIEHGRYELTSHRRAGASGGGAGGGGAQGRMSTLVIGPGSMLAAGDVRPKARQTETGLFSEVLALLSSSSASVEQEPTSTKILVVDPAAAAGATLRQAACLGHLGEVDVRVPGLEASKIMILARLDSPAPAWVPANQPGDRNAAESLRALSRPAQLSRDPRLDEPWGQFIVVSAGPDLTMTKASQARAGSGDGVQPGECWRARVCVRSQRVFDIWQSVPVSSDAEFCALSKLPGMLMTVVGGIPMGELSNVYERMTGSGESAVGAGTSESFARSWLPIPDYARAQATGRQIFMLRESSGNESGVNQSGGNQSVRSEAERRLTFGAALESNDPDQMAKSMDPAIARFVHLLEERFEVQSEPPFDFAGAEPRATRVLPVQMPPGGMAMVSSLPLTSAWTYPMRPLLGQDGDGGGGGWGLPGWWLMNITQTAAVSGPDGETDSEPVRLLEQASACLTGQDCVSERARWVALVQLKPRLVESLLISLIPDFQGIRTGARSVEHFTLKLAVTPAGEAVGDVELRLVGDPPGSEQAK